MAVYTLRGYTLGVESLAKLIMDLAMHSLGAYTLRVYTLRVSTLGGNTLGV